MTTRLPASGRASRWVLAVAIVVAAVVGYSAGRLGWQPGSWRTQRVREVGIGGVARPNALELPPLPALPVRNVVLLFGDGMGLAQTDAARWAAFGTWGRFVFERFPVVGLTTTGAVGAPITESAASATALATGVATRLGAVGAGPDGRRLRTILEAAHEAGLATGLVTTSEIYDATPAAFVAHHGDRGQADEIARQVAAAEVDLLIGAGRERFNRVRVSGTGRDRDNLLSQARGRGVALPSNVGELERSGTLPLWFLLEGRLYPGRGAPPLGKLAERGLELLASEAARRGTGFFALVEEEAIDSASHGRDLETMVNAFMSFDAAVAAAVRFAVRDGQTLLLVVADHGTGGLTIDHTTTAERLRVAWASGHHSGESVPIYAYGPAGAAERFTGTYHQSEVARRLATLLGLDLSANWKGTP